MSSNFILKSYSLDKKSAGKLLSPDEVSKEIKSKRLAWIHLDANSNNTKKWLTSECDYLDPIIISGLLAEETRPRIEQINDGLFLILRCINFNENSDPDDMVSIRIWIDPYRIITIERRRAKSIDEMERLILSKKAPKDSGHFLSLLLHHIFNKIEPILDLIDENMDNLEEQLIENPNAELRNLLTDIRRQAISYKRYMVPQRDVLNNLRMVELDWIDDIDRLHLRESYNNNVRYVEDLDSVRERAQIVKDELSNSLTDKVNKNMYVLSLIAAIFLPLSFLTGLLGVNISGIPGANDPNAFYLFLGFLTFLVMFQLILFKRWKWL